ncbi:MAG: hypothetical protein H0U18_08035, partial [Pyrinomonadaceae bacterium]|nr:hypothetical protein [Pyrinomonadaceae bacterium]
MPTERTTTIMVYKFDELDDSAKEHVLDKWREHEDYGYISDCIQDDFKEYLTERGLPTDSLEWSVSWSQGPSPVSFNGTIDVEKFLRFHKRWAAYRMLWTFKPQAWIASNRDYHISVEASCVYDDMENWTAKHEAKVDELQEELQECVYEIAQDMYYNAQREIEYQVSDEVITETILTNEYEFDAEGN